MFTSVNYAAAPIPVVDKGLARGCQISHVPLDVVGEHAQKDVGPHPILQSMVDRADLQIDRFQGAKRPLHLGEPLVAAHHFGGVHPLRGKRRANDIRPVEGCFRREIQGYAAAGRRNKPWQWDSQRNIQAVIL
jgi:hypothetical protein